MKEEKIFIISIDGDNSSPYWNILLNKEKKQVEFEGAGIDAPSMDLKHYVPDYDNISEQETIEQLKEYFE